MDRLTYDFCVGGNHCWQVRGADNFLCKDVCENQGDNGCEDCPIKKAIDRLAAYEDTGLTPEEVMALTTPPNAPLTEAELREMDGEPVWVEWGGHPKEAWALVRVWSKANGVIYLTYHNGDTDLLRFVLDNGGKIYRRKPENQNDSGGET